MHRPRARLVEQGFAACSGRERERKEVRGYCLCLVPAATGIFGSPPSFPAAGAGYDLNEPAFHCIPTLPTALLSFVYFHTRGNLPRPV